MLFFLSMMDRRLRLQLFVLALIIGVGILPSQTVEGFRCYNCNARKDWGSLRDDLCDTRRHKIDEDCSGACLTKTDNYGTGKVVQRYCDSMDSGKFNHICAHEVYGGCFINNEVSFDKMNDCQVRLILADRDYRSLKEGNKTSDKGRTDFDYIRTLEHCYCNTDLCNGPPGSADGDSTTEDPEGPHDENSGLVKVSSNGLVLAGVFMAGFFGAVADAQD